MVSNPPLHAFISENRDQILARCVRSMKELSPDRSDEELIGELPEVIDEIVRALQHDAGFETESPLPGKSESAMRHGGRRQRRGYPISRLALDFGSISDSVGAFGAMHGLNFGAREYQIFNVCIDTSLAAALEQFWLQERDRADTETLERFGFLAHELRNALASGRAAFVLLKRGDLCINSRTGAVLERSLARVEGLISQTLLAVQLRAGLIPEPKRIRVADFLQELVESAVTERNVWLSLEVDPSLEVEADERLLVSAVSNLVQNALKFTHPNGMVILRGRHETSSVVIEVEDQCSGLPTDKVEELLQPNVQPGEDRRGLGLGLSITREAVEAQGGKLVVKNIPGRGCIFAVQLRATEPRTS